MTCSAAGVPEGPEIGRRLDAALTRASTASWPTGARQSWRRRWRREIARRRPESPNIRAVAPKWR